MAEVQVWANVHTGEALRYVLAASACVGELLEFIPRYHRRDAEKVVAELAELSPRLHVLRSREQAPLN